MAENTGPDVNTYPIPAVLLGDTFNTWRDITNTAVYKLNKLKLYEGISTGSISVTTSTGGTLSVALLETITTGHTFAGKINFSDVVTFNGSTVTMNAQTVTIDDYNIVLGDLASASDAGISAAGGGGLLLNRGSGATAEWLWQNLGVHGVTGVWRANSHIGFSGATSGLYPAGGGTLPVHGLAIRLDGGATSDHGLNISLTNTGGAAGATSNRVIEFSRYSPTGATVFMEVLNGTTYGAQPFVNIRNGVNRKRVRQVAHGLSFGTPVYVNASGNYIPADCTNVDKAEVVGVISNRVDADIFEVTFIGEVFGNWTNALVAGSVLATGGVYYLSTSAGKLSLTPSRAVGTVHKAVLIANSSSGAVVLPFTGGLLAEDAIITAASTVGKSVQQINKFRVGDAVRWVAGSAGLSYAYTGAAPSPGFTSATYADGIYVKAQADTEAEAEVVGIVTDVTEIETSDVNSKFTITTTGFFDATDFTGLSATNSGNPGQMAAGTQYFLSAGSAGNTQAFESSIPSITDTPPALVGQVRKPLLFSTTAVSGHIISYRGDVNNAGQSSFTGYTGASADYIDLPTGSIVMGTTGSTLSPNVGVTLYYHNSGGLSGEYGIYLGASTTGVTMNGTWKTRGRALDRGTTGVTAYHLCQRIS